MSDAGRKGHERAPEDLEELLQRARQGDRAATQALLVAVEDAVQAAIYRVWRGGLPAESADDLKQDALLAFYEKVMEGTDLVDVHGYAYGIARNLALRLMRSKKGAVLQHASTEEAQRKEAQLPEAISTAEQLQARDLMLRLDEHLAKALSPQEREVYQLHFGDLLDASAVAERLGKTPVHIRVVVSTIRKKARVFLESSSAAPDSIGETLPEQQGARPSIFNGGHEPNTG